ncbi:Ig-like domain-containing protein [Nanoarchaeota archaeon]
MKWKVIGASAIFAILLLSVLVLAQTAVPQTVVKQSVSDTYTKWYFTRDECRYIFPAGSCVVEDKYCDQGSYDYQVIDLEPHTKYCEEGTIVYTDPEPTNNKPKIVTHAKPGECEFMVNETDTVRLKPEGYDPDPEIGPAGKLLWTFFKPFDKNGVWRTVKGDAGRHDSKLRLSDGALTDERTFCVDVLKTNSAPKLSGLQDMTVEEGKKIQIRPVCTDPDGDKVTIKISGWMTSDEKNIGYDDEGKHTVTVTCTDPDGDSDKETITITVVDVNRPPTLTVPKTVTVDEGKTVKITAKTSDPDGDKVTVTFAKPFKSDGTWTTVKGDAGTYDVKVTASDGDKQVTKTVKVIVNKVNTKPSISSMRDLTVYEGDTIELRPNIRDPDGDKVTVKYSGWMTTSTKKTGYDDAGEYDVTVTATDPTGDKDTEKVHITVLNRNRPPVITRLK